MRKLQRFKAMEVFWEGKIVKFYVKQEKPEFRTPENSYIWVRESETNWDNWFSWMERQFVKHWVAFPLMQKFHSMLLWYYRGKLVQNDWQHELSCFGSCFAPVFFFLFFFLPNLYTYVWSVSIIRKKGRHLKKHDYFLERKNHTVQMYSFVHVFVALRFVKTRAVMLQKCRSLSSFIYYFCFLEKVADAH